MNNPSLALPYLSNREVIALSRVPVGEWPSEIREDAYAQSLEANTKPTYEDMLANGNSATILLLAALSGVPPHIRSAARQKLPYVLTQRNTLQDAS